MCPVQACGRCVALDMSCVALRDALRRLDACCRVYASVPPGVPPHVAFSRRRRKHFRYGVKPAPATHKPAIDLHERRIARVIRCEGDTRDIDGWVEMGGALDPDPRGSQSRARRVVLLILRDFSARSVVLQTLRPSHAREGLFSISARLCLRAVLFCGP